MKQVSFSDRQRWQYAASSPASSPSSAPYLTPLPAEEGGLAGSTPSMFSSWSPIPSSLSFSRLPLEVELRGGLAVLFSLTLLLCVVMFMLSLSQGVIVATIDGNMPEAKKRAVLNQYNFYSGALASIVVKPLEFGAALVLPLVFLTVATRRTLESPSVQWNLLMLLLTGGFIAMLTNGFTSLSVQMQSPYLAPAIDNVDLYAVGASVIDASSPWHNGTFSLQSTTSTVLRTAMVPPVGKVASTSQCKYDPSSGAEWNLAIAYGFRSTSWLPRMLHTGVLPQSAFMMTMDPDSVNNGTASTRNGLPMTIAVAADLAFYGLLLSEALLSWNVASAEMNGSFTQYLNALPSLKASQDIPGFLRTTQGFVRDILSHQPWNYSVDDVAINMSRFEPAPGFVFDSFTLDIPLEPQSIQRRLVWDDGSDEYVINTASQGSEDDDHNGTNDFGYEFAALRDCSSTACLIDTSGCTAQLCARDGKSTIVSPQIQAFADCIFDDAIEDIAAKRLTPMVVCKNISQTSMLVHSFGKRAVADELVLGAITDPKGQRKAFATKARRYHTITMGRLSWTRTDLAARFHAECKPNVDCTGITYKLEGHSGDYLVAGQQHLPLSLLPLPEIGRVDWTPLVKLSTPISGDLLYLRNARNVSWSEQGWMCSENLDRLVQRMELNQWYMEHGVQEAYTAAMYFLFQNATQREKRENDNAQMTLNFQGSTVLVDLRAIIPLQSAAVSIVASVLLCLCSALVLCFAHRKQADIQQLLTPHTAACMMIDQDRFPRPFMRCEVLCNRWPNKDVAEFKITGMVLKHTTEPIEATLPQTHYEL